MEFSPRAAELTTKCFMIESQRHGTTIEIIRTVFPGIIFSMIVIAIPSLKQSLIVTEDIFLVPEDDLKSEVEVDTREDKETREDKDFMVLVQSVVFVILLGGAMTGGVAFAAGGPGAEEGAWGSELSRGGTCAFAADAPSGEPGPAAVPGIPDQKTRSVPEQPPLEPQGVSLE